MRATKFESCFTPDWKRKGKQKGFDDYRPIWWFTDKDKQSYENFFDVEHSKLYTEYGFKRSGCAGGGCPYNSDWFNALEILKEHEPMLYKASYNVFGKSYEYTLAYKKYKEDKTKNKIGRQLKFWEE